MADNPRIDDLRRRVQKDPASIAFAQLAEEYRRAGQCDEAVQVCRSGLTIHPGYLSARVTLGRALIELGQLESAQHELQMVLVSAPDTTADDPTTWTVATRRAPTDAETLDLDLAWRLVRGVTSNAIVLVRDRRLIGMGSGQTSRVDAARGAVAQARAYAGEAALAGAGCASDAFYPFADAVEVCLAGGVTAFAQPGGSMRDADVVAAVDAAGGTMLTTGTRHFRH